MLREYVVDMIVVGIARHRSPTATMLDDNEDVFDSVTWETPSGGGAAYKPPSSGPGFRQSTSDSVEEPRPHDPKWEGYLITSVKDPVKELAETKDAYVSYLVSAKVRLLPCII
jgi:sorting nexin-4